MKEKIVTQSAFLLSDDDNKRMEELEERDKKAKQNLLKYLEEIYDEEIASIWRDSDALHAKITR